MSHNIYRILMIPPREFTDELETIRAICQKYNAKELTNKATNELLIHFDNIKSWKNCCEEIQLAVDEIVFKTHSKYTIIKKTMKQTIDPTQAPEWFLAFQKQVLTFQEFTVQQFKKQEQFNKRQEEFNKRQEQFNKQIESEIKNIHVQIDNMDKHQPTWFTQWVQTDFKPLQARIDNLIKINNLKE